MNDKNLLNRIKRELEKGGQFAKIDAQTELDEPMVIEGGRIDGSLIITDREFKGNVAIVGVVINGDLTIRGCTFGGELSLKGSRIRGTLSIVNCEFAQDFEVDLSSLHIDTTLLMRNVTANKCINLTGSIVRRTIKIEDVDTKELIADRVKSGDSFMLKQAGSFKEREFNRVSLSHSIVKGDVNLEGVTIRSAEAGVYLLDLEHTRVSGSIFIHEVDLVNGGADLRCFIEGQLSITDTKIENSLKSEVPYAICMANAKIGESVMIVNSDVLGHTLLQAHIGNSFVIRESTLQCGIDQVALKMDGTKIEKYFSIECSTIIGSAELTSIKAEEFSLTFSEVFASDINSQFSLRDSKFGSRLAFSTSTVRQHLNLSAHVGSDVIFKAVEIDCRGGGANGDAVCFTNAKVAGTLFLRNGTSINGNIDLFNAFIEGGILTAETYAELEVEEVKSTELFDLRIARELTNPSLNINGKIRLDYAEIGGPCLIHNTRITDGFSALHAKVEGDVHLCNCRIGQFLGKDDKELVFDAIAVELAMANITGRLWMKSSDFFGDLRMDGMKVGNEINLECGRIFGNLRMREAFVEGRCFSDEMSTLSFCPLTTGDIDFSFSNVSQMDLRFSKEERALIPRHINLTMATIDTLRIMGDAQLDCASEDRRGSIDTSGFTFRDLSVKSGVFAVRPTPYVFDYVRLILWFIFVFVLTLVAIHVRDFTFHILIGIYYVISVVQMVERIVDGRTGDYSGGKRTRSIPELDLLEHTTPFNRGFFLAVEKWFRESGFNEMADEVFLMRRRRESGIYSELHDEARTIASHSHTFLTTKRLVNILKSPWAFFSDFSFGFGVRYQRLIHCFVLLFLLNIGVFLQKRSVERPLSYIQPPYQAQMSEKINYWEADGGLPKDDEWKFTNAFFMSLRVQIPIIALGSENDWEPSSRPFFGESSIVSTTFTFEEWANFTSIVNFVLIPMILAGLSRQFRSRDI